MHTPSVVIFRGVYDLVCGSLYSLIFIYVSLFPSTCLCFAGEYKDKLYIRVSVSQLQYSLSGKSIKAQCSTRSKKEITVLDAVFYLFLQSLLYPWQLEEGDFSMACETGGTIFDIAPLPTIL